MSGIMKWYSYRPTISLFCVGGLTQYVIYLQT